MCLPYKSCRFTLNCLRMSRPKFFSHLHTENVLWLPILQRPPSHLMVWNTSSIVVTANSKSSTRRSVWMHFKWPRFRKPMRISALVERDVQDQEPASDSTLKKPFEGKCWKIMCPKSSVLIWPMWFYCSKTCKSKISWILISWILHPKIPSSAPCTNCGFWEPWIIWGIWLTSVNWWENFHSIQIYPKCY